MTTYPHHPWKPWKFASVPRSFWYNTIAAVVASTTDSGQQLNWIREYLEEVSNLSPTARNMDRWREITSLGELVGYNSAFYQSMKANNVSLNQLLALAYPDHDWKGGRAMTTSSPQAALNSAVDTMLQQ